MTLSVIINADDYGLSDQVSEAIRSLVALGAISSTTVMANLCPDEHLRELARLAKASATSFSVGVHCNLTEGSALTGKTSLTDAAGTFAPYADTMKKLMRLDFSAEDLERELLAQIARVRSFGLVVSHLDSHQHMFRAPKAFAVALNAARKANVRAMRSQRRAYLSPGAALGQRAKRGVRALLGLSYQTVARLSGVRMPQALIESDAAFWQAAAADAKTTFAGFDGVVECFAHPSTSGDELVGRSRLTAGRADEFRALEELGRSRTLKRIGVQLVSFSALG